MNTSLKKAQAVIVVVIALMGTIVLVGCSKKNGASLGSSYSVGYEISKAEYSVYDFGVYGSRKVLDKAGTIKVTVKGPASKLAVILTGLKGEADIIIIEPERMISNCQTAEFPLPKQAGTYILAVKTFNPEKVVWQKEIVFSLDQLVASR